MCDFVRVYNVYNVTYNVLLNKNNKVKFKELK